MDMGPLLINVVVIAALAGGYFVWDAMKKSPAKRGPRLAGFLGLKYAGPPPKLTGQWKGREVSVALEAERTAVSLPVARPEGLRLEIGPREAVEKAAGIVVQDKVAIEGPEAGEFNEKFMVRSRPADPGRRCLDPNTRRRIMAMGGFHLLAVDGKLGFSLPASSDSDEIRSALDLASSLLDAIEQ